MINVTWHLVDDYYVLDVLSLNLWPPKWYDQLKVIKMIAKLIFNKRDNMANQMDKQKVTNMI